MGSSNAGDRRCNGIERERVRDGDSARENVTS